MSASDQPIVPRPRFRSSMFWESDLASAVDQVQIAADEYDPQDRIQFLRDAAKTLHEMAEEQHADRMNADQIQ